MKELNRTTAEQALKYPVKVVQFGEGNFLRAFVDWILDNLNQKGSFEGSVMMVQPIEQGMAELINKQQGLYHTVANGLVDGIMKEDIRLVSSVAGCNNPFTHFDEYLNLGKLDTLEFIISNTTEAGIQFVEETPNKNQPAKTYPGKLTQLLFERYNHISGEKSKGLTIMPCELINNNGEELKNCIHRYIKYWNLGHDFSQWIDHACSFHNTLVDRIVTGYPKDKITHYQALTGFSDQLVVTSEQYHIWVIENKQKNEKLTKLFNNSGLNVLLTDDMQPYRTRKVRILNGAHTSMVPVGLLAGKTTVLETVSEDFTKEFTEELIFKEIAPVIGFPEKEINFYAQEIIDRFKNESIIHNLSSIALNSISKFKVRVLPTIFDYYQQYGKLPQRMVFAFSALICFYRGEVNGTQMPVNDEAQYVELFKNYWLKADIKTMVNEILGNTELWDSNLLELKGFNDLMSAMTDSIMNLGVAIAWEIHKTE